MKKWFAFAASRSVAGSRRDRYHPQVLLLEGRNLPGNALSGGLLAATAFDGPLALLGLGEPAPPAGRANHRREVTRRPSAQVPLEEGTVPAASRSLLATFPASGSGRTERVPSSGSTPAVRQGVEGPDRTGWPGMPDRNTVRAATPNGTGVLPPTGSGPERPPDRDEPPPPGGRWGPAELLNDPGDWAGGAHSIKTPVLVAAADGGFHAAYLVYGTPRPQLRYRRFADGGFGPAQTVIDSSRYLANPAIALGGDGSAHLVWENWAVGPEVGWSYSTDGGNSFSPPALISDSAEHAKWPQIAPYGDAADPTLVVSYWHSGSHQLRATSFDGGAWGPDLPVGANGANEYQVTGMARSPVDGSVYRLFGRQHGSAYDIAYTRFTGAGWEAPVDVVTGLGYFPSRFSLAISDGGQILVAWDSVNSGSGRIFAPERGWGDVLRLYNKSFFGNVVAVPGTNDFYVFNPYARSFVTARPVRDGVPQPLEYIGTDLPDSFIPNVQGAAGPDGTLYACWEYWANQGRTNPQAYCAVRAADGG